MVFFCGGPSVHRFEIFEGNDGQWYWRIVHINGQTICISEGYQQRGDAEDTIMSFLRTCEGWFTGPHAAEVASQRVVVREQKQ
jgi:uncharacterized protein YegP (UPF0339 family)